MKNTNFIKKHWKAFFLYPIVIFLMIVSALSLFNYLLVPPELATIVETIMYDVKHEQENIEIAFVGSSRTYKGIDSVTLSEDLNKNIFNVAYESATYYATYYLLEEVEKTHDLKQIFLEVSISNFSREKGSQELFVYRTLTGKTQENFAKGLDLDYTNFKPLEFKNYLQNFSNGRFIENIALKAKKDKFPGYAINSKKTTYIGNGFLSTNAVIDSKSDLILPKSYGDGTRLWKDSYANNTQVEYFHKIMKFCENKNIEVVLFSPPYPYSITSQYANDLDAFDLFVKKINESYGLEYIDFSKLFKSRFELKNKYFYNANHLNGDGAAKLKPIILNVYNDLSNNTYDASNYFYNTYSDMMAAYNA